MNVMHWSNEGGVFTIDSQLQAIIYWGSVCYVHAFFSYPLLTALLLEDIEKHKLIILNKKKKTTNI